MRRTVSWALAVLAAVALMVAVVAAFAVDNVFDADGFAARTEQALRTEAVSDEVARRLADAAIAAEPDLVAIRPLVISAAEGVVRSGAFGAVVRGAVRDVHRSAFDADAGTITLTIVDAGVLLSEALDRLRPDLAARIPDTVRVRLTDPASGAPVRFVETAENVKRLEWFALLAALLLAAGAVLVGTPGTGGAVFAGSARRAAALRVGVAVSVVAGLTALVAALLARVLFDDAAARAALDTWLDPLALRCAAVCAAGLLVTSAAASLWHPPAFAALLERARALALRTPRPLRALAAVAVGVVAIVAPLGLLRVLVMVAGGVAVLWGTSELLRVVAPPAPLAPRTRTRRRPRARPVIAAAAALLLTGGVVAFAFTGSAEPMRVGRCNGSAELCARTLDQVALVGTHNSMSADGEPGWLFAAQNAGIDQQLRDGVRALLIDTHYGFQTPRGVATDLEHDSISRAKIEGELGEAFVDTAQRLRARMGYNGGGTREVFLCHAFCEVGATRAVDALKGVHDFLVANPEEVLIISIEDDTEPADTAALFRESGLIREVYTGPAGPPWPTLETMIERNERVLVLIENQAGEEPWMHRQDRLMQETPFHFADALGLEAEDSCHPNRGGTTGSLLLVNHWVDTSPAPRKTIARLVNAPDVLGARLQRCREERGMLPNIVAVDFYRDGDVFRTVEALR